jgi:hypothetical protein
MEQTTVSEQFTRLDKFIRQMANTGSGLTATFLYEDDSARKSCRELYEHVTASHPNIRPTWWKISDLVAPGVLAGAVSTAIRADIVVVSAGGAEGLPLPFYVWVNSWLTNRVGSVGALVALLGNAAQDGSQAGRVEKFLQAVAQNARMTFFCDRHSFARTNGTAVRRVNGSRVALRRFALPNSAAA